jgi:hypothetical protein
VSDADAMLMKAAEITRAAAPLRAAVQQNIRAILLVLGMLLVGATRLSAQAAVSPPTPLLVDEVMTAGAGATVTNAAGRLAAHVEDRFVPLRLFAERGRVRRGGNATYRLGKLVLFDEPQENWLRVANHEVFGHGGRLRDLFDGRIGYDLPPPPPYGRGGGATFFEFDRPPSYEEVLAVSAGGMEANYVLARALAQDAMTTGQWHYRDARRYLYAEYDTIRYILDTGELEKAGHDVGDFRSVYNELATKLGEKTLSARTLRRRALASLANPLIAYSYYSTFVSYVWSGRTTAPVPMIRFGQTRYLPLAHFHLTSFGTEFVIDNAFVRNGRFMDVTLGLGETVGARTWSVGLQGTRLTSIRQWTIDGQATLWRQTDWGGQLAVTATRRIAQRGGRALAIVAQGGFKTDGFSPGDRLYQGAIIRVGAVVMPTSPRSP